MRALDGVLQQKLKIITCIKFTLRIPTICKYTDGFIKKYCFFMFVAIAFYIPYKFLVMQGFAKAS